MRSLGDIFLFATHSDLGSAVSTKLPPAPDRGKIRKLSCVVNLQPTTAAAVVTLSKNGVAQTPTLSVPTSLTANAVAVSVDMDVPVEEGDNLQLASDGGPANAPGGFFTVVLARAEGGA